MWFQLLETKFMHDLQESIANCSSYLYVSISSSRRWRECPRLCWAFRIRNRLLGTSTSRSPWDSLRFLRLLHFLLLLLLFSFVAFVAFVLNQNYVRRLFCLNLQEYALTSDLPFDSFIYLNDVMFRTSNSVTSAAFDCRFQPELLISCSSAKKTKKTYFLYLSQGFFCLNSMNCCWKLY